MNEMVRSTTVITMIAGNGQSFDPKIISASELGKTRAKSAFESLMTKAVAVEKQRANTVLQSQLAALAWDQITKGRRAEAAKKTSAKNKESCR